MAPNLIAIFGDYISDYSYSNWKIYDAVKNVMSVTNGYETEGSIHIPFLDRKGVYLKCNYTASENLFGLYLIKDARYLATINNLSEPVVKTASKTMKVTYTLTFGE